MFEAGAKLKFNEAGLHHWTGGTKKAMERCANWRFVVVGMSEKVDYWGNKTLCLQRVDKPALPGKRRVETLDWSFTFFEVAED